MSIKSSLSNFWNRTKKTFKRGERNANRSANRAAKDVKKGAKHAGEAIEDFAESTVKGTKHLARDIEKCDCMDWYGRCKTRGDTWTDEGIWMYACDDTRGAPATFAGCLSSINSQLILPNSNDTIEGFWQSCEVNIYRIKYQQEPRCTVNGTNYHVGDQFREGYFQWLCLETGRWVTGCYYQNETKDWNLLNIGEKGYNGLIQHVCDRYKENPGRVQYTASIRTDVPHKSPTNKGKNQNLVDFVDNRLKEEPVLWTHENAVLFIESKEKFSTRIRYLPPSRSSL